MGSWLFWAARTGTHATYHRSRGQAHEISLKAIGRGPPRFSIPSPEFSSFAGSSLLLNRFFCRGGGTSAWRSSNSNGVPPGLVIEYQPACLGFTPLQSFASEGWPYAFFFFFRFPRDRRNAEQSSLSVDSEGSRIRLLFCRFSAR